MLMNSASTTPRFHFEMYKAALEYYGLSIGYTRTFKQIFLTNKDTGDPLLDENGKQKTALSSCNLPKESLQGNAVWVQVNEPFEEAALRVSDYGRTYPKKAKNSDIQFIRTISLDFEYPQEPRIAHEICYKLIDYLIEQGLAEEGLPGEDTGGGCHIGLSINPIETTPETALQWNSAITEVVKSLIKPEFDRLCQEAGITMDLSGFDISRVLSLPGTWRPYNPEKNDCKALQQGYLRRWLPPYTGANFPVRRESGNLTQVIRDMFESQPAQKEFVDPSQWLRDYAAHHPSSDRSGLFQTLVNATFLRYDEYTVLALKDTINYLSGEKYNGRIDKEIQRSLDLAKREAYRKDSNPPQVPLPATDQMPKSYNLTDLGNAERFATKYRDTVRWCEVWNTWMIFNGKCWEADRTGHADRLAKVVVRNIYKEAAAEPDDDQRKRIAKHANASESNRSVRAMLDRAKSELPVLPADFNKHLYLLNCKNGTLDLRTGEMKKHDPSNMLTRCLKINYNPKATCPKWEEFIQSILAGDPGLIQFMKEALGMSLCGDTSEQCLFICHGSGSNGKTTMLETIRIIMEDYGLAANIETFQVRKNQGIGNDVAELYGARFVTASENTMGSRLNEAFIKKATGKEPLRARRLHENEFEFMPEFTIWFAVNHKPVVKDTSKGMWRRVHFIPFVVTIEGDKLDKHLGEKLLEESEGILAWQVRGSMDWHKRGRLEPPETVVEATKAYRSEMDTVAHFLEQECILGEEEKVKVSDLNERYETWCKRNGEKSDVKDLKTSLKERGYQSRRGTGGIWIWPGIGMVSDSDVVTVSDGKSNFFSRRENTSQKTMNLPSLTVTTSLVEHEFEKISDGTVTKSPPDRECIKCGVRDWKWHEILEDYFCGGCSQ
jgi:P4 family phage/plasmid primase-like protien